MKVPLARSSVFALLVTILLLMATEVRAMAERRPMMAAFLTTVGGIAGILQFFQILGLALGCAASLLGVIVGVVNLQMSLLKKRKMQQEGVPKDEPEI